MDQTALQHLLTALGSGRHEDRDCDRAHQALNHNPIPLETGEIARFQGPTNKVKGINVAYGGNVQLLSENENGSPGLWHGKLFVPGSFTPIPFSHELVDVIPLGFDPQGASVFIYTTLDEDLGTDLWLGLYLEDAGYSYPLCEPYILRNYQFSDVREMFKKWPPVIWREQDYIHYVVPRPGSGSWTSVEIVMHDTYANSEEREFKDRRLCAGRDPSGKLIWIVGSRDISSELRHLEIGDFRGSDGFRAILPSSIVASEEEICFLADDEERGLCHYSFRKDRFPNCRSIERGHQISKDWCVRCGDTQVVKEWVRDTWHRYLIDPSVPNGLRRLYFSGSTNDGDIIQIGRGLAIMTTNQKNDHEIIILDKDGRRVSYESPVIKKALRTSTDRPRMNMAVLGNKLVVKRPRAGNDPDTIFVFDPFADEDEITRQLERASVCHPDTEAKDVFDAREDGLVGIRHIGEGTLSVRRFG